jgi:hypothetical protein
MIFGSWVPADKLSLRRIAGERNDSAREYHPFPVSEMADVYR